MGWWLGGGGMGGGVNVPCKVHLIVLQRKVLQYTQKTYFCQCFSSRVKGRRLSPSPLGIHWSKRW